MILGIPSFDADLEQRFIDWRTGRLRHLVPGPAIVGAVSLMVFASWDWALDPSMLWPSLLIRFVGALAMVAGAAIIRAEPGIPFPIPATLVITSATAAIAATQALVDQGFHYGTAGLALFPTVSAIAVVRARDVPATCLPSAMIVTALVLLEGMHGFALFNVLAFFGTGVFTAYILAQALERSARHSFTLELELEAEARMDPLTGTANRRRFEEQAEAEVERTRRFRRPLSVLVLDLDHFKKINDGFGHPLGDAVLRAAAQLCRSNLRQTDLFARLGGEEFAALLPETTMAEAEILAERLRRVLAETVLLHEPQAISVTTSIGIASCDEQVPNWRAMLADADRALYAAKRLGRNRVVRADMAPAEEAGAPSGTAPVPPLRPAHDGVEALGAGPVVG